MTTIPQVDNGKQPLELVNIVHVPQLPSDTPYGNLLLKGMNIVRRLDRVNLEVVRVFSSDVHPKREDGANPLQDIVEHQFYAEQVVYWLRKTADELIALARRSLQALPIQNRNLAPSVANQPPGVKGCAQRR